MAVNDSEINLNSTNIETASIEILHAMNKIGKKINVINSATGYGSISVTIHDKKVKNVKYTISEEFK